LVRVSVLKNFKSGGMGFSTGKREPVTPAAHFSVTWKRKREPAS